MYSDGVNTVNTNSVLKIPDQLIEGVEGKEFLVNNWDDEGEFARVMKEACDEVFRRTGGAGFPVLCNVYFGPATSTVKRLVERAAGARAILYNSTDACSGTEVEEWLRRRRSGEKEERKCLVTDRGVTRGWEASHVLVVDFLGLGWENLVMRTVGHSTIVRKR